MFTLRLICRNAFRHKLRTGLTVLGITIAILAFGLLRTVINAWYAGVDASSSSRLVTRNAISLIFPLPSSYRERIRQTPGVKAVSYGNWFGGLYINERNFFPNFAVHPETYLDLYPEFVVADAERAAFLRDRKGAVAGRKLMNRFGWKVGDNIVLKGTIYPGDWEMTIRGMYRGRNKSTDETQFFFHWDYINESLKKMGSARAEQTGFYIIGIEHPEQAAQVALAVDRTFKNSLAETLTETEKAFQMGFVSMSDTILAAIQAISGVVIIIIMAVMANTMSMTARERAGEYAVLKTLGFGRRYLTTLIFGESLIISVTGCMLGIALTFPATRAFGSAMSDFLPTFNVSRMTIYLDVASCLLVAVVSTVVPVRSAMRIRIADGLRKIA